MHNRFLLDEWKIILKIERCENEKWHSTVSVLFQLNANFLSVVDHKSNFDFVHVSTSLISLFFLILFSRKCHVPKRNVLPFTVMISIWIKKINNMKENETWKREKAKWKNKIHRKMLIIFILVFSKQPSAFSLGDLCVPQMANVLKVFLENGQTKSFKYDTTTTVQVRIHYLSTFLLSFLFPDHLFSDISDFVAISNFPSWI